ncbi:hypothetical protein ACFE04_004482 [Oxalis oulophora]
MKIKPGQLLTDSNLSACGGSIDKEEWRGKEEQFTGGKASNSLVPSTNSVSTRSTRSLKPSSLSWSSSFPTNNNFNFTVTLPPTPIRPLKKDNIIKAAAYTRRSRTELAKKPNKKSWKQRTDMYMKPFLLNVFFSKKFVHAKVMHRATSKVISVATTNAKDLRHSLPSLTDHNACRIIGKLIAERSMEADVFAISYEPRKDERIEGKLGIVLDTIKEHEKPTPSSFQFGSICLVMSSTAVPGASYSLNILRPQIGGHRGHVEQRAIGTRRNHGRSLRVFAETTQEPAGSSRGKPGPGEDTRIHWENEDEGWVGGSNTTKQSQEQAGEPTNLWGDKFSDLLNESSDSHYQFLGVSPNADMEEIKSAYRRLSKEYHPDTTSLPLKQASNKFLRLRQIYDELCDEEKRRFYDWTLAQEAASRQAEKLKIKLEDPYIQEVRNYKPVPEMVDRLAGRNMELSDQAVSALTFDVAVVIFSICCIVYVVVFKEPY